MKIDYPVICAFVVMGCLVLGQGRSINDPLTLLLIGFFLAALVGLGIGLWRELVKLFRDGRL